MKKETIRCKNIKKSFSNGAKTFTILHDITFSAYEKEIIMLMGPSGSGKSTLISIIAGILTQDSGECTVLDKEINYLPTAEKTTFRGEHIGFLFQHFILIPTLTALENVAIPLLCTNTTPAVAYEKAHTLLQEMEVLDLSEKTPKQLSGGEQQRVALARACIHNPTVILCDEPTSFLDFERGKKAMELLVSIRDKYTCTIIVVTHDPRILSFADRIIHIEDGNIKEEKNELKNKNNKE